MTPEHFARIEDIFLRASELTGQDRGVFLAAECGGDHELLRSVERLLASEEQAGNFIESPIWTDSNFLDTSAKRDISNSIDPTVDRDAIGDLEGTVIGNFRLEREIGRGGMGAVYLAKRADGEFDQQVAIKIIKRGIDSDFIIRRFRHERQILASFEHPNIARLLDGGTLENGIPYFVMEFIRGDTLYDHCDEARAGLAERLVLFRKICKAIEYAHRRQVIHRDIKPSNILIDQSGEPKLLDFGIAKILDPNLIHESVNPTASMLRMMTPDYASPEQIRGEDVTPASDIYSLGILLYELVSGYRPFNFRGRAIHEITFAICETPPPAPSTLVGYEENLHPRYSAEVARAMDARATDAPALQRSLKNGLEDIIMKAIAKRPSERYASAAELSSDIYKYLRGEPVSAASNGRSVPGSLPSIEAEADGVRSLAVLPFRYIDLSPGENTGGHLLGLGLADGLISRLSNARKFLVRPTSSVIGIGDRVADPVRAGVDLGVDFVLDGTVKRAANRLRVTVQLLDVPKNAAVWATSIDETLADILTLENSILSKVIDGLLPQLTGSELARMSRRGTDVPEAFEHYIRGRYHFNTFTEDGLATAFVAYHRAIAADPQYALAYAGLADYYNWLGIMGVLPPIECFQPAIDHAIKAAEFGGDLSEAQASLGFSLHAGRYDWAAAERHLQKAIHLNPANANAFVWYSIVLFTEGRFDEGIGYAKRGIELDPLTPFNHHNLGWGYYFARRFDDAFAEYARLTVAFPEYALGYYGLSKIRRITGSSTRSVLEAKKALDLMGGSNFARLALAESLASDGRETETLEILDSLEAMSKDRFVSPYQLALAYTFLARSTNRGEFTEKAISYLESAFRIKEGWLNWMGAEPAFDILRDESRFKDLLEDVGYAQLFRERPASHVPVAT